MDFLNQIIDTVKSWFAGSSDTVVRPTRYNKSRVQSTKTKAARAKPSRSSSSRSRSTTTKSKATPRKSSGARRSSTSSSDRRKNTPAKAKKSPAKSSPAAKRKSAPKKAPAKKKVAATKKKSASKGARAKSAASSLVGEVTHYFSKIKVCVIKVNKTSIKLGDQINIKGKQTDNLETIESLQIESVEVKSAKRGQLVGVKLKKPVRVGDKVFRVN